MHIYIYIYINSVGDLHQNNIQKLITKNSTSLKHNNIKAEKSHFCLLHIKTKWQLTLSCMFWLQNTKCMGNELNQLHEALTKQNQLYRIMHTPQGSQLSHRLFQTPTPASVLWTKPAPLLVKLNNKTTYTL
jgi:hypothetical protein